MIIMINAMLIVSLIIIIMMRW